MHGEDMQSLLRMDPAGIQTRALRVLTTAALCNMSRMNLGARNKNSLFFFTSYLGQVSPKTGTKTVCGAQPWRGEQRTGECGLARGCHRAAPRPPERHLFMSSRVKTRACQKAIWGQGLAGCSRGLSPASRVAGRLRPTHDQGGGLGV